MKYSLGYDHIPTDGFLASKEVQLKGERQRTDAVTISALHSYQINLEKCTTNCMKLYDTIHYD